MIEIVGVDAAGPASLGAAERALVADAEVVLGGRRHLDLLPPDPGQERIAWPSPLRPALPDLLGRLAGRRGVVLASGDPLVSGIGSTIVDLVGVDGVRIHPAVSSVALARARLGWSAEDSDVVTLVGRRHDRLRRHLAPRARLIVLTHGEDAPARLAALLAEEGYGASTLTVFGDLGTGRESRTSGTASDWTPRPAPSLHLVTLECRLDAGASARSLAPGLPDDAFDNDGQISRRVVRAAALAHLAPTPGDVLWDLGAGAGSVGIEFARQHPRNRVVAVERDPARAARIRANAARLGVPDVTVVESPIADALPTLPAPDAVFIGGGATASVIADAWTALPGGGRLVAHAVTVETEALLLDAHRVHGGHVTRIALDELEPIGRFHGWKPARAVTQWSATRPATASTPGGTP